MTLARLGIALLVTLAGCAGPRFVDKGVERAPKGITEVAGKPRRFALLVGVDSFDDDRFHGLQFAGADATAIGEALTGYDSVRVLTGRDDTLKSSVLAALDQISKEATNPQDTVVVYVSSHGTLARQPGGALERVVVTRDTRFDLLTDTGLRVDRLRALIDAMPARRKALILALCHSGKGKSVLDEKLVAQLASSKGVPATFHDVSEGMLVLTACAFGETARESAELGHDVYTHGLLEALKHGDRDGDGAVTALEAHDYAREATWSLTEGAQRPTAEVDLVGRDPVVLAGEVVRSSSPTLFSYSPASEGLRLRVDGTVKGRLPGGIGLDAGLREVAVEDERSGAVLYRTTVALRDGDRLDLTDVLPPPPSWQVGASAATLFAVDEALRSQVLPWAFGARVHVSREVGHFGAQAGITYLTGTGSLAGLGEAVGFRTHAVVPTARGWWTPSHRVGVNLGVELGWMIAIRDAATRDFRSLQSGGGFTGSLRVGWSTQIRHAVSLGVGMQGGLVTLPLQGQVRIAPVVGAELSVAVLP